MKKDLIQKKISLANYCTFKTGGKAQYFAVIKGIDDLKQAVGFAKQNQLPVFVLGGGSNLLISDDGVEGLVIKMEMKGITFSSSLRGFFERNFSMARKNCGNSEIVQIIASAGEIWDDFVGQTVEKGLYGLENLSYIPGTVGASAVQNIGAYGVEVKDVIDWVEVFDMEVGKIKILKNKDCQFGYRDSIFKKEGSKNLIIIRVAYNLQKNGKLKTGYKDIQMSLRGSLGLNFSKAQRVEFLKNSVEENRNNLESSITLEQLRKIIIEIRQNKLPDWKKVGTVGSFFKNPTVTKEQLDKLLEKYPELPYYNWGLPESPQFKIPLAYILDKILGLKGFKEGNVGLYENQPLALINFGDSTSTEIKNLAQKIQKDVKQKTGLPIDFEAVEW